MDSIEFRLTIVCIRKRVLLLFVNNVRIMLELYYYSSVSDSIEDLSLRFGCGSNIR